MSKRKLTPSQVEKIKSLNIAYDLIGERFGIHVSTVSQVKSGKYKHSGKK